MPEPEHTYTVQITFHRGKNLPVSDIGTLSSDPYVLAFISSPDHLDLEPLSFRTPTIRRNLQPTWNASWIVGGVPASGFKLSMIVYDEDPGAKISQDRLGKAVGRFGPEEMKEGWESVEKEYTLQKRKGDLHPYILTYLSALLPGHKLLKHNRVVVSVCVLRKDVGREVEDGQRIYTLGPNRYSRHFSPLIGSMVNKSPRERDPTASQTSQMNGKGAPLSATTFIANKFQLTGPVPLKLRHRYVGYRPFIDWMFSDSGIAGHLLHYSLRKQYRTIYKCDKTTIWGVVEGTLNRNNVNDKQSEDKGEDDVKERETPLAGDATPESSEALARQFLEMAAWGEGAKLFTYVITLDGEWRFTETGPEFAIDLLSKHSMHANLAKEIAFSGEFFVQKLDSGPVEKNNDEAAENGHASTSGSTTLIPGQIDGCASSSHARQPSGTGTDNSHTERNPKDYELVIDNDSGTYRPKKELLPLLEEWLSDGRRLGGLGRVHAMDGFDESLKKMKEERQRKKAEIKGKKEKEKPKKMVQVKKKKSGASSISSGEIEPGHPGVSGDDVTKMLNRMEETS